MPAVLNPLVSKTSPVLPAQYALVKDEYSRCLIRPTFFDDFYKEFTSQSLEIRQKFANTEMTAQKDALRAGLTFLIMYAEGKSAFAADKLDKLGDSHKKSRLNIRPDLYPLWMQSLIATVKKHVVSFNDASLKAWQAVLQNGVNRIKSHYND